MIGVFKIFTLHTPAVFSLAVSWICGFTVAMIFLFDEPAVKFLDSMQVVTINVFYITITIIFWSAVGLYFCPSEWKSYRLAKYGFLMLMANMVDYLTAMSVYFTYHYSLKSTSAQIFGCCIAVTIINLFTLLFVISMYNMIILNEKVYEHMKVMENKTKDSTD